MNDKDDFVAETNIKNYNAKYFCSPIDSPEINSSFEQDGSFKAKVKKDDKILAVQSGLIIFTCSKKDDCFVVLQHENGFVSAYNFIGKILKKLMIQLKLENALLQ